MSLTLYACPHLQVQGLMEVFGREWCHAYVWTVNGSALWTFTRDRRYWAGVYEVRIFTQHDAAALKICKLRGFRAGILIVFPILMVGVALQSRSSDHL